MERRTSKYLAETAEYDVVQEDPYRNDRSEVIIHSRVIPSPRAKFAMDLMEKHATVAAAPDGEDSAGRQTLRLQTSEEVVDRCCDISERAFAEFERRGWVLTLPTWRSVQGDDTPVE